MTDQRKKVGVDIDNLLSLADDMVKVLNTNKDGAVLIQSCDSAITLMSSFLSSSSDLCASIEECQEKVNACRRDAAKVKSEPIPDDELVQIQKKLEEIKKTEESLLEELRKVFSMCASVTNIVPNLYDQDKISGYILDKNKKRVKTFEFVRADFDVCNHLWKMPSK